MKKCLFVIVYKYVLTHEKTTLFNYELLKKLKVDNFSARNDRFFSENVVLGVAFSGKRERKEAVHRRQNLCVAFFRDALRLTCCTFLNFSLMQSQ